VEGDVTVPRRGARLSDFLAQSDRDFITVANARITLLGGDAEDVPFAMLARRFVKMVTPGRSEA
jgi:hypothetical protein